MSGELRSATADGVRTLTLDRPQKRNALSLELRMEIAAALGDAAADDGVRCTMITGAGSAFCAGMDTLQFGGDATNRRAIVETSEALVDALLDHPKPLVAAVNGPALGGGFVLALLCDIRVAAESARFGFPEVARGIPAAYGAARHALAPGPARELALSGRVIDAREALALHAVSAVVADARLLAVAAERAAAIAALPPRGPQTVKAWSAAADDTGARALLALERDALRAALL